MESSVPFINSCYILLCCYGTPKGFVFRDRWGVCFCVGRTMPFVGLWPLAEKLAKPLERIAFGSQNYSQYSWRAVAMLLCSRMVHNIHTVPTLVNKDIAQVCERLLSSWCSDFSCVVNSQLQLRWPFNSGSQVGFLSGEPLVALWEAGMGRMISLGVVI